MSKIALITDTHFSVKDGKSYMHDFFDKFYSECFFPTLEQHGVKTVLHLGDCFDRRKNIDFYSLKRAKEYFFSPMYARGIQAHILVGNHDIALRNSLEINSTSLLLTEYPNITPIAEPSYLALDGTRFLMLPWICTDNYAKSMEMIKDQNAAFICGHLEMQGFQMYRGVESHEGFETTLFDGYARVFSGHYHHRSTKGNITYLGAPYEMTWSDYNDPRGFHIFDTETHELTFIKNPFTLYERVVYDDSTPANFDFESLNSKFVKIVVESKTNFYAYEQFLDKTLAAGALDVKIVDNFSEMSADEMSESVNIEDTQSILRHYVETAEVDVDRTKLAAYMTSLYIEALNTKL